MPNIISLDLREGDRRWDALFSKEPHAYTARPSRRNASPASLGVRTRDAHSCALSNTASVPARLPCARLHAAALPACRATRDD